MHDDGITLVPLTQGKFAIIDSEDAERVLAFKWHAICCDHMWYAARNAPKGEGRTTILMHRFILGLGPGELADHVDSNGLRNVKSNLRQATHAQNSANQKLRTNNTSGFRGVYWNPRDSHWRAQIQTGGRRRYLGSFTTAEEAARAYDAASRLWHGDFGRTNFPD